MTAVDRLSAAAKAERREARIPIWRRITALFSLAFVTVVGGFVLAGLIGATAVMLLFVIERAIGT